MARMMEWRAVSRSAGVVAMITLAAALVAPNASTGRLRTSPLDGRWTFTWTRAQLNHVGAPHVVPAGTFLVEFRNGRLSRLLPRPVLRGARFTTSGNVATLVFPVPAPAGLVAGRIYTMRWSIYRDRLTWSHVPGRAGIDAFAITPWTRVR